MSRTVTLRILPLVASILLAACSGGGATARPSSSAGALAGPSTAVPGTATGAPSGASQPPGVLATPSANGPGPGSASADPGASSGHLPLPAGFRPSGARIRIANLYRGSTAEPGPVDVYGNYAVGENDTPLLSVPYGSMSDWFDPGILDDQRNAHMAVFPHGVHGPDDEIAAQSETLKGDERLAMFLAAADTKNASGQLYGRLRVVFELSTLNPIPTPPTGQAVVILDLLTLTDLHGPNGYLYLSTGGDCLANLRGGNDGPQPMSANTTVAFAIPAGPQVLTFHPDTADCHGAGQYDGIPVNLAAGQRAFVVPFAPDGRTIRSLVVPIEP